jgi:carbon-monoxide dehydrogenase catalytic subunit
VAGFSLESLLTVLASVNPQNPVGVITDALIEGQLSGVVLFCGCNNLKGEQDHNHLTMAKELARRNVLLLATGCSAQAMAKNGLLNGEAVEQYAGEGLKQFLHRLDQAAGLKEKLPLVLHMGSCVDNTRAANLVNLMAQELGVDVPKVPFAVSAPEAMSEKAVSIGSWFVAMGLPTHVGTLPPIEGNDLAYGLVTQIASDVFGGHFIFETDPEAAAAKVLNALDYRRWKLKVHAKTAQKFSTPLCQNY